MSRQLPGLALVAVALIGAALPAPLLARGHGHRLTLQGAHGGGFTQIRSVERQRGQVSVDRSLQTHGGRGYQASRDAQWGNGSFSSSRQLVANDARSASRVTSATRNGDGTASYASTLTGPRGGTRTISGTATRHP